MKAEYQKVTDHLLFPFPDGGKVDAGILLGGKSTSGNIARAAAQAYANGEFDIVIFCGGNQTKQPLIYLGFLAMSPFKALGNVFRKAAHFVGGADKPFQRNMALPSHAGDFWTDLKEADNMKQIFLEELARLNVRPPSEDNMMLEDRSTNTEQNFTNIADEIQERGIKTMKAFSVAYLQRRGVETAAVRVPDVTVFPHPIYPFGFTKENWSNNPIGRHFVMGEFRKLSVDHSGNYYERGYCLPTDINELTTKAQALGFNYDEPASKPTLEPRSGF